MAVWQWSSEAACQLSSEADGYRVIVTASLWSSEAVKYWGGEAARQQTSEALVQRSTDEV
jgi:hypothetical protein